MKYQESDFHQVSNKLYRDNILSGVSVGAMALYGWLKYYEHCYCGKNESVFFHSDNEISQDMHIHVNSICRYRKELVDAGIIKYERRHFKKDNGKLSEKRVASYEIIY